MTAPFPPNLEAALKEPIQNARFSMRSGIVVTPKFHCCISGTNVGIDKDPVAIAVVNPTNACAGAPVTCDYSLSYSPTSTINTWSVSWGDGQVSNGAWPGAGSVAHPLGGYVLPGTYYVTLTVTDLLGATGNSRVMVTVIDCTAEPLPIMFAACGSSGVWVSEDGGLGWAEYGLSGIPINDLGISPFSEATRTSYGAMLSVLMWAATPNGLYLKPAEFTTFQPIALPDAGFIPVTVYPSGYDPFEVYVLATDGVGIRIYRSQDEGLTWTSVPIGVVPVLEYSGALTTAFDRGKKLGYYNEFGWPNYLAAAIGSDADGVIYRSAPGTWIPAGSDLDDNVSLCYLETGGANNGLGTCGDGGAQHYDETPAAAWEDIVLGTAFNDMCIARSVAPKMAYLLTDTDVSAYQSGAPWILWPTGSPWNLPVGIGNGRFIEPLNEQVIADNFLVATDAGRIVRCDVDEILGTDTWTVEWVGANNAHFLPGVATMAFVENEASLLIRGIGPAWAWDTIAAPDVINAAAFGFAEPYVATDNAIYIRNTGTGMYDLVCALSDVRAMFYDIFSANLIAITLTGDVYYISLAAGLTIPADGRHHLMSMSSDGYYLYVCCLDAANAPYILRYIYDFSGVDVIYNAGTGTWGGVTCGLDPEDVWFFGDFGNEKVYVSNDYGDTLTDVTDAGWAVNELVRPLLKGEYDPDDAIAILNTALETWRTKDFGAVWVQSGVVATPWAAQCGVRDYIDDRIVYIGVLAQGVDNIRCSPDTGYQWIDRSLPTNAEITAIEIAG